MDFQEWVSSRFPRQGFSFEMRENHYTPADWRRSIYREKLRRLLDWGDLKISLLTGNFEHGLILPALYLMDTTGSPLKKYLSLKYILPAFVLLLAVVFVIIKLSTPSNPFLGSWNTGEPTNLVFEFKNDTSVMLHANQRTYPAWHYKVLTDDTLQLVDGMGRPREYRYVLSGDTLDLYESAEDTTPAYHMTRVK